MLAKVILSKDKYSMKRVSEKCRGKKSVSEKCRRKKSVSEKCRSKKELVRSVGVRKVSLVSEDGVLEWFGHGKNT